MSKDMVHAMVTVDRRALRASPEQTRQRINDTLLRLVVDQIVMGKVVEVEGVFNTEFRITLVVKSPDEYYRDVQKAAMESSVGYPHFMEVK